VGSAGDFEGRRAGDAVVIVALRKSMIKENEGK